MRALEWRYRAGAPYPDGERVPLSQIFAYAAREWPERPAISDGEASYTFSELEHGAQSAAAVLRNAGINPGARVVVLTSKRAYVPVCAAAIWKAGGVYVPIDSQTPPARIDHLVTRVGAAAVIGPPTILNGLSARSARLSYSAVLDAGARHHPAGPNPPVAAEDEPAYIMFTSGSTGQPKGVAISHRSLLDYFFNHNQVLRFTEQSRVLSFAPFHFDVSVEDTMLPLSLGAFVYQFRGIPIAATVTRVLRERRITHMIAVSTILTLITNDQQRGDITFPDLEMVMTGAEVCDPHIIHRWMRLAPHARVINAYGPTEATIVCLTHTVEKADEGRTTPYPIGRPLPRVCIRLVGADREITAAGVAGELWVGGSQVMLGYFGEPAETARAIETRDGVRYYRTGDICRFDRAGLVEFLGRADDEVKIAGHRINLREVAQPALAHAARAVAGVLPAQPHPRLALIVIGDNGPELLESISRTLAEQLPEYMRPQVLAYADRPALTSTGKTDEKQLVTLLQHAWARNPRGRYALSMSGTFEPASGS